MSNDEAEKAAEKQADGIWPFKSEFHHVYVDGFKDGVEWERKRQASGWISTKDGLPEKNETCIVNTEWRGVVVSQYGNESWIFDEGQGYTEKPLGYVSYWMPLPTAPQGER